MSDIQSGATIIDTQPHRSYTLRTGSGHVIRRNVQTLRLLLPERHHQQYQDNSIFDNSTHRMRKRDVPAPILTPMPSPPACASGHKVT